jgi:DNA-binding LacI/PurR family transcriptional regulator
VRHGTAGGVRFRGVASAPDDTAPRTPRIRDVAERAGVAVSTVSRVLNDAPGVAAPTRERVRAAMAELCYSPSSTARNLSLGRTHTLAVIAPFFTQPSVVERLRGIDEIVGASAYDLTIFNIETPEQRQEAMARAARRDRADGVVVISIPLTDAEVRGLRGQQLPAVLIDAMHAALPHVVVDDEAGGALAAEHLLERGHHRIAFVGDLAENPFGFASSERRLRGLRAAIERAGGKLREDYVRRGPFGRETARGLTRELLALDPPPTAIFAASDTQAFGVLDAVARAGLVVPDDVSVIGFDDIEVAGAIGLTTVRQPLRESGRIGARLLLAALEDDDGDGPAGVRRTGELSVVARRTVGVLAPDRT